jgi:hypothetical protein
MYVPGWSWAQPWRGHVRLKGVDCVHAAITAVIDGSSLRDVMQRAVRFGGDVDTVATIAMGAAACCPDLANDLPNVLYQRLEDGAYGRTYLDCLCPREGQIQGRKGRKPGRADGVEDRDIGLYTFCQPGSGSRSRSACHRVPLPLRPHRQVSRLTGHGLPPVVRFAPASVEKDEVVVDGRDGPILNPFQAHADGSKRLSSTDKTVPVALLSCIMYASEHACQRCCRQFWSKTSPLLQV